MRFPRRPWLALSALATLAAAGACGIFPDPDAEFEKYQERLKSYDAGGGIADDAGDFDAGPPPTEATEGTYLASCLSELANGQVGKVFSFWATTSYTPNADATTGGALSIKLEALKLTGGQPPTTITRADIISSIDGITGSTDGAGSFSAALPAGTKGSFGGAANPISGSNVVISNAGLKGRFAAAGFCARLVGYVEEPAPAARDLDENRNICLFSPVQEGDTAPTRVFSDYAVAKCPL